MAENFVRLVIRWRYAVVLLTLILVALCGIGAQRLAFSNDYRAFFGADNPQLLAFERMQNTFNKNDNISFVITPKDGRVFSVDTLTAIKDITTAAWQIPYSTRVDSITNYQHTSADGDDLLVEDLVPEPSVLTDKDLARIQSIAVNEPMLVHRLISPDSHYTGINVVLQLPGKTLDEVPKAVAYARNLKQQMLEKYPGIEIRLTGIGMMNNAFSEASQEDAAIVSVYYHHPVRVTARIQRHIHYTVNHPVFDRRRDGDQRLAGYPANAALSLGTDYDPDHGDRRRSAPAGIDAPRNGDWSRKAHCHDRKHAH
jgi:uncharacterized protein